MALRQYAFFVNSDACSGCKTCQVACKDRNDLPAGLHWRRVYEVTAGGWQKKDGVWLSTVAAYNLSVSCHHCWDPACVPACSTEAIWKREDGLVLIDESRCTKCYKCGPACPYDAMCYVSGSFVSKCNFCPDELAAGRPPACVAACPNRALDFGDLEDLKRKYGTVSRVFPLPDPSTPGPALVIRPHRHAALVEARDPEIANWEEL
jgi:anaerobic dimethyl sulfoxide reductase subunit B (iron-sulfur subunit)